MSGLKRMRAAVLAAAMALPLTAGGSGAAYGTYGTYGTYDKMVPAAPALALTSATGAAGTATPRMSGGAVAEVRRDVSAIRSSPGLPIVPVAWHRASHGPHIPYCDPNTGPYQMQIERLLHLLMYERQTHANCIAIRHYQRTHGIHPAIGYAGPVTWHRLHGRPPRRRGHVTHTTRITSIDRLNGPHNPPVISPNAARHCPAGDFRVACVDQNLQIMWVQRDGRVIFGPVRIRTGYGRYQTRNGMHRVYWKHRHHVSTIYDLPMPYAQFFDRGEAFHGIYGRVTSHHRSYGCVNMRLADARRLWTVLRRGDRVYLWGHVPGHPYDA